MRVAEPLASTQYITLSQVHRMSAAAGQHVLNQTTVDWFPNCTWLSPSHCRAEIDERVQCIPVCAEVYPRTPLGTWVYHYSKLHTPVKSLRFKQMQSSLSVLGKRRP